MYHHTPKDYKEESNWWQFEINYNYKIAGATFLLEDHLVGNGALSSVFPHLYHLFSLKNHPIWLLDLVWELCLFTIEPIRKQLRLPLFFIFWRHTLFREGRRDVCIWSPNLREGFSCKSFFRLLLVPSPIGFTFDSIWRIKIPNKIRFFIWQFFLGRLNTLQWGLLFLFLIWYR